MLLSDAVPTEHGPVATRRVIAADGGAVEVTVSAMAEMIGGAVTLREAQWDGRPLDGKLAVIAAPDDAWQPTSDGPDWGPPFADAYFTGPRAFLDAGARVEAQVAWLRDNESDLLATTPSNLAAIVEHLGTNNTALPRLRYVRTSGRPAAQQLHRASADLWGARLHDGYVDPILGAIAYPCPEIGRAHV